MEFPIVETNPFGKVIYSGRNYFYLKVVGTRGIFLTEDSLTTTDLASAICFPSRTMAELFIEMENFPDGLFTVWEKTE